MKSKYLLLTLLASAGLIAADAPAPDAPAGQGAPKADAPAGAPKGDKKRAPKPPDGVSEADFKKIMDLRKQAKTDPTVSAAQAAYEAAKKADDAASTDDTKKALTDARSALAESQKAFVVKSDPTLADAAGKVAEADKKRSGKGGPKHDGGQGAGAGAGQGGGAGKPAGK